MFADYLLNLAGNKNKQAWIGLNPQFNMDIVDMEACTNYRLAPSFQGQYDIVWFYEKALSDEYALSWKIMLDEAVRLLKQNGILILKIDTSRVLSVAMVKHFLGRNINLNVEIDYEEQKDNLYTIVFKIERLNFEIYSNKSWTFAMLTNGNNDEVVVKFLESIRKNERDYSEIIISGPHKDIYDKYDVKYLDLSQYRDEDYPEISKKKNDIVNMASNTNILIAHDRYYLEDNFFNGFEKYGYDFDYLSVRQTTENGENFPSYNYTYGVPLSNSHPGVSIDLNKLFDTMYVNGGLLVFKTSTLKKIGFNNLCFWNQKEDVELAHELISKSIVPRVNFISEVITTRKADAFPFDKFDGKIFHHEKNVVPQRHTFGVADKEFYLVHLTCRRKRKFPFISLRIKLGQYV